MKRNLLLIVNFKKKSFYMEKSCLIKIIQRKRIKYLIIFDSNKNIID